MLSRPHPHRAHPCLQLDLGIEILGAALFVTVDLGIEIVEDADAMAVLQECIGEMGSDEPRPSGDQYRSETKAVSLRQA